MHEQLVTGVHSVPLVSGRMQTRLLQQTLKTNRYPNIFSSLSKLKTNILTIFCLVVHNIRLMADNYRLQYREFLEISNFRVNYLLIDKFIQIFITLQEFCFREDFSHISVPKVVCKSHYVNYPKLSIHIINPATILQFYCGFQPFTTSVHPTTCSSMLACETNSHYPFQFIALCVNCIKIATIPCCSSPS